MWKASCRSDINSLKNKKKNQIILVITNGIYIDNINIIFVLFQLNLLYFSMKFLIICFI